MTNLLDTMTPEDALAALAWQVDLGAVDAICEDPIDRYARPEPPRSSPAAAPQQSLPDTGAAGAVTAPQMAEHQAMQCNSVADLRASLATFEGCELKRGARNLVFSDGLVGAHVMIIGEAPGREEDREGKPFVGRSGQLLDRMFAAIGLQRDAADPAKALYITNILPWRPPQNRDPSGDEIALMLPFLKRHVALAAPRVIVTMGNASSKALLETTTGITRLRGQWSQALGLPVLPMFHPAALLRGPEKKRDAWADLLAIQDRLRAG